VATVADNRVEEAVDIVARWIIAFQARNVEWGDYADIGMDDWERVQVRLGELADGVQQRHRRVDTDDRARRLEPVD